MDRTAELRRLAVALRERLDEHDLYGANDVYDTGGTDASCAGAVGDATRHQFVDTRTRGDH